MKDFDVLIVGSGLAGLTAAMRLAPTHRVAILTKRSMSDGSSGWAQGGIAAVMAEDDSFQSHVDDTLVAGAGLSQLDATRFVEFADLFNVSRGQQVIVVTFIAMLELARERLLEITQAEAFAPIYVRLAYQPA